MQDFAELLIYLSETMCQGVCVWHRDLALISAAAGPALVQQSAPSQGMLPWRRRVGCTDPVLTFADR